MKYQALKNEIVRLGGGPALPFVAMVTVEPTETIEEAERRYVAGLDGRQRATWDDPKTQTTIVHIMLPDEHGAHRDESQ